MKRTTIITISAIVFGFVFWSTLPGLLSSVKTKTLSIDDTENINLKDLTSLTFLMKPGAEDDYEEEGLFGDYTFDIRFGWTIMPKGSASHILKTLSPPKQRESQERETEVTSPCDSPESSRTL